MCAYSYKRTFARLVINVRFTPESGHTEAQCPPRDGVPQLGVHGSHGGVPIRTGGGPNGLGGTPPLGGQHRMPCVKLRTQPLAHAFQAGLPATKRRSDERAAAWLKAAETL